MTVLPQMTAAPSMTTRVIYGQPSDVTALFSDSVTIDVIIVR
jgi:hypothetical protein